MSTWKKALLLQIAFLIGFPCVGGVLIGVFRFGGVFLLTLLFFLWCWQIFTFLHYRHCRQEEFLFVLQTAAATQSPMEGLLRAYIDDRPREHIYRGALLFFVFPGYYWIHLQRSFDARLTRLAAMLESGIPLSQALRSVPGVVSADVAMAVAVGQFTGKLPDALRSVPERRTSTLWLEMGTRLLYPALLMITLVGILSLVMIFIIPKFEKIFQEFRLKLPEMTELLIAMSRFVVRHGWLMPFLILDAFIVINLLVFSSSLRWYMPMVGYFYRMQMRGQFLRTLGLMLETGKPLPAIVDSVVDAGVLPYAMHWRVVMLADDLREGIPLADALARRGLATSTTRALIVSAENARNLPWALQELGDSMLRRSTRLTERLLAVGFPLAIFVCALLIGFVAYALFEPLTTILDKMHG